MKSIIEAFRIKNVLKGISGSDSELVDPGCGHELRTASLVQYLKLNPTVSQSFPIAVSFLSWHCISGLNYVPQKYILKS